MEDAMEPIFRCRKINSGYLCRINTEKSELELRYRNDKLQSVHVSERGKEAEIDLSSGISIRNLRYNDSSTSIFIGG